LGMGKKKVENSGRGGTAIRSNYSGNPCLDVEGGGLGRGKRGKLLLRINKLGAPESEKFSEILRKESIIEVLKTIVSRKVSSRRGGGRKKGSLIESCSNQVKSGKKKN